VATAPRERGGVIQGARLVVNGGAPAPDAPVRDR